MAPIQTGLDGNDTARIHLFMETRISTIVIGMLVGGCQLGVVSENRLEALSGLHARKLKWTRVTLIDLGRRFSSTAAPVVFRVHVSFPLGI